MGFKGSTGGEFRPVALPRVCGNPEWSGSPSGSCTTMVRIFYPQLLEKTPQADDAKAIVKRVFEFSEFLTKVAKVTDVGAAFPHRVTYHDACHALRELHLKQEPRALL